MTSYDLSDHSSNISVLKSMNANQEMANKTIFRISYSRNRGQCYSRKPHYTNVQQTNSDFCSCM